MRTVRGLFPRLCHPAHLDRAATATVRGKRRRPDVAWFLFRREAELESLRAELAAGTYRPEGCERLLIRDPRCFHPEVRSAPRAPLRPGSKARD